MSFVPNLEACHCLLLIFDASFDILFTFLPDMWRKHLYQSIRCRASVVRMSGLPYSLLFWGAGVYSAAWFAGEPTGHGSALHKVCIRARNQYVSLFSIPTSKNFQIYVVLDCEL